MADRTHVNGTSNGLPNGVHNETVNGAADGLANGVEEPSKRGFIGAIDQGTTSTRFIIFEVATGEPVAKHQLEIENHHPHPGWHEHDPKELLHSVTTCMEAAFADFVELGHTKDDLRAIGITNQRETTIVWDGRTGETLHNAIVWSDTRTADKARQINEQATSKTVSDLTGLPVSTYPSAIKLSWLLNNVDEAKEPVHVTDSTNASRTMLMNLRTLHWEDSIIQTFGLDKHPLGLPRIVSSSDPNAFGSIFSGQAKNTYGTGCFLLYNVGKERPDLRGSGSGLISTVAYDFATTGEFRQATYALEGSIATAGSGVKFLVKNLGLGNDAHDINALANSVPNSGGVVFVTAFSGLLAPYWIDDARGTLFGLTQFTQKGHIARATLDATCYQAKAILDAMAKQSGSHLDSLAVDGGLSNSDLCMQSQADISGIPIDRPAMHEITALGAAYAAGLGIGAWTMDELIAMNARKQGTRRFEPNAEKKAECERMYRKWGQAVQMSRGWATDEDATAKDEQSASSSDEDAPFDLEHMN
ncbi:glycerol kinase like protein [Verticillium longisporum]|uniref:glycerol kinase n=1 Tax=Verticillium longisporum TaxID=100787 RepID=A0A8I2ZDK1_VERLO|nr:glycerol kinase like protein [Verticillium longisporum]